MSQKFTLNVIARAQTGRSASRRLRKANRVPAILYGRNTEPEALSIEGPEFIRFLKSVGDRAVLIELNRGNGPEKSLSFLQEIQRDRITDKYLHVDLQAVKADEKFEIKVPLRLMGESFGVKNQNGVLEINTHQLRVRVLPKDLPEAISVDVTELKVGDTIKVSSLQPIPGVEFLDTKGQPIVSCVEPVAEVVEAVATPTAAAAPGAAPAEGAAGAAAAPAGDAKAAAPAAAGAKPAAAPAAAKPAAAGKK